MTTVRRMIRFLPVFLGITLPAVAQEKPPDVSLPYGAQVEIEPRGRAAVSENGAATTTAPKMQGRLPITLAKGLTTAQMSAPLLRDIQLNGRRSRELAEKVTVTLLPDNGKVGPALGIEVDDGLAPGTYELAVEMRRTQDGTPVVLDLKVIKPAATLESLPKEGFSAERVVWFWRVNEVIGQPLRLQAAQVPLTNPKVVQILAAGPGGRPVSGKLRVDSPPTRIEPGQPVDVEYSISEWFPLGTSTGTLSVTSPELTAPLRVPFTISVRLQRSWLLIFLLLGLLVGYVVRVELQRRLENAELQERGWEVVGRLDTEKGGVADALFQREIDSLRTGMVQVLQAASTTADALRAKIQETEAALKRQLDALSEREAATRQQLTVLEGLVAAKWQVPDAAMHALQDAKTDLADVRQLLDLRKLDDAEKSLSRIEEKLAKTVKEASEVWRGEMLDSLAQSEPAPSPLLTAVREEAKADRELAETALRELGARLNEARIDAVTLVPVLHGAFSAEVDAAESLARRLSVLLSTIRNKLDMAGLPAPQPVADFAAEGADLVQKAGELSRRPSELVALIAERHRLLHERFENAVLAQITDEAELGEIRKLISEGRLLEAVDRSVEAARRAAEARSAAERQHEKASAGGVSFQESVSATVSTMALPEIRALGRANSASVAPVQMVRQIVSLVAGATPPPSPPPIVRARTTIARAKLAQTLIAGALVAMTGYFLFDDTFIGTAEQLATAFVWAFGLDFGLDKAIETSRKLVKV